MDPAALFWDRSENAIESLDIFIELQFEDAKEEPDVQRPTEEGGRGHDAEVGVDGGEAGARRDHEQDAAVAVPAAPGDRDERGADAAEGGQVHDF